MAGVAGRAGWAEVASRAGFVGFGLGAVTTVVGSCVPPGCVGAASLRGGVSPGVGAGDAGAAGAGASLPAGGAVCAKAPTQSDEIRKDVEASNRGRNDTEAPS